MPTNNIENTDKLITTPTGQTPHFPNPYGNKYKHSQFATFYADKHERTLVRRVSNARERRIMAKALSVLEPFDSVLDLPSGTGRFWPILSGRAAHFFASDLSLQMVAEGGHRHAALEQLPIPFVTSAFQPALADKSVDVVFCSRLIHHFSTRRKRVNLLCQLSRLARKGVVVSFFDSNTFKHRHRLRKQRRKGKLGNRHAMTRQEMADEAAEAGLTVCHMFALLPGFSELTAAACRVKGD